VKPGFNVLIEKGAGMSSHFSDAEYESAGAKIVETEEVWKNSDIVMKVGGYQMTYVLVQIAFIDLHYFRYCVQK
jgi:alanine dehydrogenase